MLPVAETNTVVGGASSEIKYDTHNDQADNLKLIDSEIEVDNSGKQETHGDNLDEGEPELGFTIIAHTGKVNRHNDNEEDGDPNSCVGCLIPVCNDDGSRSDFGREGYSVRVPVIVTERETERRIEPASGVVGE